MPNTDRTEWWATCHDCLTNVIVRPHPDREDDLPDPDDWDDSFASCYVCGSSLDWNSDPLGANDTTHPATVARLKRQRDDLQSALSDLVALKDGPRDDVYRQTKGAAWQSARIALGKTSPVLSQPTNPTETGA